MAGYVGTKAVLLSTTAANVGGDADIGGALDVGGAFTSQGIDDNATSTAMTLDASGNVGIGTSSPARVFHVQTVDNIIGLFESTDADAWLAFKDNSSTSDNAVRVGATGDNLRFYAGSSERMRIDSSGKILINKTTDSIATAGTVISSSLGVRAAVDGGIGLLINRLTSDGDLIDLRKNGTTVGSIGANGGRLFINGDNGSSGGGLKFTATDARPVDRNGSDWDNAFDLGDGGARFDDIYATNGTIQTSDRNEKQDIAELSDAEQRVAVAAKGLMRKFRWKDAVAEKGDDARTHFGIIAQDLQAAFAAEGLDAGDYAMFISSTWWEHDVEVPAVEAVAEVLDEEGNVVTEAVEAVDAYTRTDTYETQEEAPEGATERTRLGVRYSELLAFIVGAL